MPNPNPKTLPQPKLSSDSPVAPAVVDDQQDYFEFDVNHWLSEKEKEIQKKELDREREFEIKYLKREMDSLQQVLQDAEMREAVNAEREQ